MKAKSYKIIKGSLVTLRVLEHFTTLPAPVAVKDISDELQLPHGTLMTHLATLEHAGYLQLLNSSYYGLTNKMGKAWADRKRQLSEQSQKINKQLKELEYE
jgi:DNA-binding IclR family transcriptional regulator